MQLVQDALHREHLPFRRHDPGVDAGDVQHALQQALKNFQAAAKLLDHFGLPGVLVAPAQDRMEDHAGLERLAQIVAGGGQEAGLGVAGPFGGGAGFRQFARALGDAALQFQRPVAPFLQQQTVDQPAPDFDRELVGDIVEGQAPAADDLAPGLERGAGGKVLLGS